MQNSDAISQSRRPIPLTLILLAVMMVHLPLLLMKLPLKSYDTNFHIFFASHYVHHWFDPWNTKWYAGFSQATYPPLPQQWVALASHVIGLDFAYMAVQFVAILLLAVGVYRFSVVVGNTACSFVCGAGQRLSGLRKLPGLFRRAIGHHRCGTDLPECAAVSISSGFAFGKWRAFIKASVLFTAAAAAHHATLLFGSFFFALPVVALALMDRHDGEQSSTGALVARTVGIVLVVAVADRRRSCSRSGLR